MNCAAVYVVNDMSEGVVYLVGAGPGDSKLITVKGLELLRNADVVVYDQLAGPDLLKEIKSGAELIDVGKKGGFHKAEQDSINQILVSKAKENKIVVRLKGGDPFMFGRGGEEAQELIDAGVKVQVVPGVTSAIAGPALAGIPVTHRDYASYVTFVTGHSKDGNAEAVDWESLAKTKGTLVIMMGVSNLRETMQKLVGFGMDSEIPVAVVHAASTPAQRSVLGNISTIADICEDNKITAPAVDVVGKVAALHDILEDLR